MITFKKLDFAPDLQIIRDIADDIWPKTFRDILSPEQITYMMQMMYAPEVMEKELAQGYCFEVAYIKDSPAGYMVYSAYEQPGCAKLHKLYLLGKFHSRGYGSQMLIHVAAQCRKMEFSRLILNVNKYNERAIKAYKRNGFTIVESVKIDIGNGFFMDDFVMEKNL